MKVIPTEIPDVVVLEPIIYADSRGYFLETYNEQSFEALGIAERFVQDNQSYSRRGVLRGLHFQVEQAQGKLVRAVAGEVFDVAVDLRKSSATFGRWFGAELSDRNFRQLWLPPGVAHGFLVLSDSADFLYKTTNYYAPQDERCIIWNDPEIGIDWPLDSEPILSTKDKLGVSFSKAEVFA